VLLGLLLGAVVGLWPFQEGRPPEAGDVVKGRVLDVQTAGAVEVDDWPVVRFDPTPGQVGASAGLVALGFGATVLLGSVGRSEEDEDA
jgi:hypothetical protein